MSSGSPPTEVHRLTREILVTVYWFSGILLLPLLILLGLRLFDPSSHGTSLSGILWILVVWGLGTTLGVLRARIARLEIFPDGFRYVSLFRDSRFHYEDIAGFRAEIGRYGGRSAEAIGILYDATGHRRLRISAYLERPKFLREWMHAHFRDLDAVDVAEERQLLARLSDSNPIVAGRLRIAATGLGIAAVVLALVLIGRANVGGFDSVGRLIAFLVLAIPPVVLWLRSRFGGVISLERTAYRSRRVSMDSALFVPLFASFVIPLLAPPFRSRDAWPFALAAGVLFFLAIRRLDRRLVDSRFIEAVLLATSLGYGYAAVCYFNAELDGGAIENRAVVVRSRSLHRGFVTVVVSMDSSPPETHSVTLPGFLRGALRPGSPAVLRVKPGALGIQWISGITAGPWPESR